MSTAVENEPYPSDWDGMEEALKSEKDYLEVGDGESVRIAVLQGPLAYAELFFDKAPIKDNPKRGFRFPIGTQLPGYMLTRKCAFEVVLLSGKDQGKHVVWQVGKKILQQIAPIVEEYKDGDGKPDLAEWPDLIVKREGKGKNDTVWTVTAGKKTGVRPKYALNLRDKMKFTTKEEIDQLPVGGSKAATEAKGDIKTPISSKQIDFVVDLMKAKSMTKKQIEDISERKFGERDLDKLTSSQGSQLIDALKAL